MEVESFLLCGRGCQLWRFAVIASVATDRTVRVWGDTAVVTAKLREKGIEDGKPFDYTLWFSDTYVRTPSG
jgi:hypothetical protein